MNAPRWVVGVLGGWIIAAAFLLGPQASLWNDLVAGTLVALAAFPLVRQSTWRGWMAGLPAVCLVVAAFVPGLREGTCLVCTHVLVGATVLLAAWVEPRKDTLLRIGHA